MSFSPMRATPFQIPPEIVAGGLPVSGGLRLSIVVPFGDPRGDATHLEGWLKDQSVDDRAYQLVVLTNGLVETQEQSILPRLRPWDLLHRYRGMKRFELYAMGGQISQAPLHTGHGATGSAKSR